ncbi:MAG: alpha-glucan family phosphorylase, partial [Leadbetterella sp.]|nr:alpha-glucan family phosphorylase [Leadbetterella sp.]
MKEQPLPQKKPILERSSIPGYDSLEALALNLIWSWNHRADEVWSHLEPTLWELTRNPWVVLQTVSKEKLVNILADVGFRKIVDDLIQAHNEESAHPGWFQNAHPNSPLSCVAYFSMEFMLSEALPIYSGGLGNVAGDQLKSASDLRVPVVAVGLLYQQGYFRQMIDKDGRQQPFYPYNDPGQLPITPLRKPNGEWLRIEMTFPGWSLWVRTWLVKVGNVNLYLLDTNDAANFPAYRGITSELYGGGSEQRLQQELILGIAGWRLLEALGIKPEVCHLNEGHAAFVILERTKNYMQETGLSFEAAFEVIRAGNLFTTHTAVPAGFDRFSPELMKQYLERYARIRLNISLETLLALGRENPYDPNEYFNMAYLAIRGSGAINGVSRLHCKVSRAIFRPLFPRWPEEEIPVGYVTNGVHMPSWKSIGADRLWTEACGNMCWLGPTENLEKGIFTIPHAKIWQMRNEGREALVHFCRDRLSIQLAARGAPVEEVDIAKNIFDPHTLTLGFARRFATYKRPNILLSDPERLIRILTNAERPVQLVLAGKAHPADKPGQALIYQWMQFIRRPDCRSRVVFLTDYDMLLTEKMVQGVDVWINTPRRPWEACGTSGMKVLVNGGLNCSELDGWWEEAYAPEVGWALGDGNEHGADEEWDLSEANALYELLEREIIPGFYRRDSEGYPTEWIERIRESMACLTPHYSANRAVREYTDKYYLPAATTYLERTANKGKWGVEFLEWKKKILLNWNKIHFGEIRISSSESEHFFEIQVYLDDLNPDFLKIELFAVDLEGGISERHEMKKKEVEIRLNPYLFTATIPS